MPPDEARECAQGLVRLSCPGEHGCHIRVEGYCAAALRIAGRVLFGRARLKSYSGRMSSTPTLRGVASLALALFIVSPLTACGLPCADQANRFATFREHDREEPLSPGPAHSSPSGTGRLESRGSENHCAPSSRHGGLKPRLSHEQRSQPTTPGAERPQLVRCSASLGTPRLICRVLPVSLLGRLAGFALLPRPPRAN